MTEKILYEKKGAVGLIVLNNPPANGYYKEVLEYLGALIDQASNDTEIKVVLIKSASEKFFCGGADIKIFSANTTEQNKEMVVAARAVCRKINDSAKIVIAQIAGHALGGGLELAMACDLRFAAEGSYLFGLPEIKLGLMPGNGGTVRLVNLVGAGKAMELLLTGDSIQPAEALSIGLVNRLYPREQLDENTFKFAQNLAQGAGKALAQTKRFMIESAGMSLQEALELEGKLVETLYTTPDALEGFRAFVEKRAPRFE